MSYHVTAWRWTPAKMDALFHRSECPCVGIPSHGIPPPIPCGFTGDVWILGGQPQCLACFRKATEVIAPGIKMTKGRSGKPAFDIDDD